MNRRNYGDSLVNKEAVVSCSQEPSDFSRGRFSTYSGINGWIALNYTEKVMPVTFKNGDKVKVKSGATVYGTNQTLSDFVYKTTYTIMEVSNDRIVIGINGQVTTAVDKKYLIKV